MLMHLPRMHVHLSHDADPLIRSTCPTLHIWLTLRLGLRSELRELQHQGGLRRTGGVLLGPRPQTRGSGKAIVQRPLQRVQRFSGRSKNEQPAISLRPAERQSSCAEMAGPTEKSAVRAKEAARARARGGSLSAKWPRGKRPSKPNE